MKKTILTFALLALAIIAGAQEKPQSYKREGKTFFQSAQKSQTIQGLMHQVWERGMTSEKASARIDYYNAILRQCDLVLYPHKQVAETENLPA